MINEMIPDWLYDMVKKAKPLTQEDLDKLNSLKYTSDNPINVGDIILFGLNLEIITEGEIKINLIKFSPDEIGVIYDKDDSDVLSKMPSQKLPYLKKL